MRAEPESLFEFVDASGQMQVALKTVPHRAAEPADAVAAVVKGLCMALDAAPEVRDAKSALGDGKAITFDTAANTIDIEVYPIGKTHLLRLRFIGSQEMRKRFEKDIARVRASLKPLEQ